MVLSKNNQAKTNGTLIDKFLTSAIDLTSMSIAYHDIDINKGRYDSTPKNAIIIASTGVDGCHFCVVPRQGLSIDESPIYFVSPMDWYDTIRWVSKDFIDFLSIGVSMGSFTYIGCLPCDREEFMHFVNESWLDDVDETKHAIKLLQEEFPLRNYDDLYQYVIDSYNNVNNHINLGFESLKMNEYKLGCFNRE